MGNFALENRFFFGDARSCRTVSESKVSEIDFLKRCRKSMLEVGGRIVGVSVSKVMKNVSRPALHVRSCVFSLSLSP